MVLMTIPIPVTPNRYPISEVRESSGSWWAIATSTPLKIRNMMISTGCLQNKGAFVSQGQFKWSRFQKRCIYPLIEKWEESNDEETEHEDACQKRLEETADIVKFIFSQDGDIDSRQTRRYQGYKYYNNLEQDKWNSHQSRKRLDRRWCWKRFQSTCFWSILKGENVNPSLDSSAKVFTWRRWQD